MSDTGTSAFGVWQGINLVLYFGVDAPWNKVQRWPFFDWFNVYSVAFPTVVGLVVGAVVFMIIILFHAFVD